MTFAEFRNLALAIATAADKREGYSGRERGIACKVSVNDWGHLPSDEPDVEWGVWDAEQGRHFIGKTPEVALATYRDSFLLDAEQAADQVAAIGEVTTEPAPESAPMMLAGGQLSDSKRGAA